MALFVRQRHGNVATVLMMAKVSAREENAAYIQAAEQNVRVNGLSTAQVYVLSELKL